MEKDIIEKAIDEYTRRYGTEKNLIVLVEELAELQQAVCKYLRCGENAVIRKDENEIIDDIRSEIADVMYCLHYLCEVTGNDFRDYEEMTYDRAIENLERLGNDFDGNDRARVNLDNADGRLSIVELEI